MNLDPRSRISPSIALECEHNIYQFPERRSKVNFGDLCSIYLLISNLLISALIDQLIHLLFYRSIHLFGNEFIYLSLY